MNQEDFSINVIIKRLKHFTYFLLNKNKTYFFVSIACTFFLISYNYLINPKYHAYTNFVIEDDNSNKLSEFNSNKL